MPYSFAEMNNYQLIQNVKIRRALWDKAVWDRIDVAAREVMWEDIADQMKTNKDIVKARWKNIRDSYRKLLMKYLENPHPVNYPKWRYFKYLDFIKEIVLNTKSKVSDISLKKCEVLSIEPDYSLTLDDRTENDEDPLSFATDTNLLREVKTERSVNMKGKLTDDISTVSDMELDKSESQDKFAMIGYSNDDDLQFLLSLHQYLKQVPVCKKLPLRMNIEKMIHDSIVYENKNTTTTTTNENESS